MRNILRHLSTLRTAFATALTIVALCSLSAGSASAQVQLAGHMAPEVVNGTATLLGHYDPTKKLRLAVVLALPDPAGEKKFLADVYDKNSPIFHQFLSQDEWRDRFGPSAESEQAVVDWAQNQGFTVTHRYSNRLVVDLEAPSETIEQALNLNINSYQLPAAHGDQARTVFANDREPSIPARLSGIVDTVLGLNSIVAMRPSGGSGRLIPQPDYYPGPVANSGGSLQKDARSESALLPAEIANTTNGGNPPDGYTPQYFWNSDAYDYQALMNQGHCCNPTNDASGHSPRESSIAIASFGDVSFDDINAFQAYFSNLATYVDKIYIDGTYSCTSGDDNCGEVTMDTEWSLATANDQAAPADTSRVVVYEGSNYINSTIMDLYNQMEADAHARTMSTSWGMGETLQYNSNPELDAYTSTMQSIDKIFSSMSGEGWTLVAASGDQGATGGCTNALLVQFPSSDPNVTGAGGTELSEGNPYEIAWTGATYLANPNANPPTKDACDSNQGGSTGGFSVYFPAPAFQSGMGFSKRAVPDLSLDTTHGHDVYFQGAWGHPGGTSVAAPMLAGFFAQANAYLLSIGSICGSAGTSACAPIGNANYPIYAVGNHPNGGSNPFYDTTQGCNSNDITANDSALKPYCAGKGYDEVTGWGSANMLQLAWAINWELIPASGSPYVTWSGPATNKWYNTNQTVSWTIHDYVPSGGTPGTGIAGETQGWDSLPSDPYSEPHGGSGNSFYDGPQFPNGSTGCLAFEPNGCSGGVTQGCHTAYARGWNNQGFNTSGNSGYPETYGPICYDTVIPTVVETRSPALPSSGWFTSSVKVTLSATDPGGSDASGIANTFYTNGSGTCTTKSTAGCTVYGSPFTVSTQGYNLFAYFTEDKAGNFSSPVLLGVNIDETAPTTTLSGSGNLVGKSFQSAVTITLTATDSLSGVKQTTYTLDGGAGTAATVYSGPFTVSTVGSHTITYGSTDIAGNVEATQGTGFGIVSPVSTSLSVSPSTSIAGTSVKLTASIMPTLSGGTPTGTVTFYNGMTKLGTGTLSGSTATLTTSALPVGSDSITAVYGGATYYTASTSFAATATVNPALAISPGSLTFASTAVGSTSAVQLITLTNNGTTGISFTGATTITGSGASSFVKSASTCTNPLPAGASCTNSIEFKPTTAGALTATVTYTDNATGSPNTVALSGTGSSIPTLSLSTSSLTFPSTAVGSTSAVQVVTLKNTGTIAVSFTASTTITGSGASSFTKSATTCTNPLAAGASCTNSFEFKPTTTGALAAVVTYSDNATGSPNTVALSGTGGSSVPTLSLSTTSLTFPATAVGSTAAVQVVTLTNTGTSAVSFTASTTITGSGASSFTKSASTCTNPLAAGASCTNTFEFKPTTTGALTATVTYTDTATGSPNTVALSGTGGTSTPTLSLSATSLTFPATTVGSTSAVQTITLTNTGTVAVSFTAATTITGTGASSFIKSASTCTNPLAAGASCTNSIEFKPATTGALAATITYTDTATGSPNTVALSGTGH